MKRTLCAAVAALLVLSSVAGGAFADRIPVGADMGEWMYDSLPFGEFHTEEQYAYILRSRTELESVFEYAVGDREKSRPEPIVCEFWDDGIPDSEWYVFQKSATPDFRSCETVTKLALKEYEYYNAYLGEHFYWRGGADLATIDQSPVHETTVTSLAPRNCYVPGVTNVRDIGGYESSLVPGAKIKQGLYYRGAYINDMTKEGLDILYNQLGVRAEIDLRDADRGRTYLKGLEKIAYYNAPMSYEDYFGGHADAFKIVFDVISRAEEAPVYLHCQAGADRTGVASFMLLTVCGVSFEDAAFDYMFTNFSVMGSRVLSVPQSYYERLNGFAGDTKAEQAKSWMMSKGVSEETVEIIRETFVPGYVSEYLKGLAGEIDGDFNGDGRVNARDVIAVMRAVLVASPQVSRRYDVNNDGRVNSRDVIAVMRLVIRTA